MPVVKPAPKTNFTIIPNATLQDTRLSFDERGVLSYLLSRPSDWQISPTDLGNQGGIGRQKVYRILANLIEHGYCKREEIRDEKGQFVDTMYIVYIEPQPKEPSQENSPCDEKPYTDKPYTGNHTQQSKDFKQEKKNTPLTPQAGDDSALFLAVSKELFNTAKPRSEKLRKRIKKSLDVIESLSVDVHKFNAFVTWYRREKPNLSLPCNPDTVEKNLNQFLNAKPKTPRYEEA